ncbi:MBL fold metallo-hydrolase [Amycolatopsis dendrobii]|uniref:MBL fold metallo-hydrolase n=1 Tax=Amycolatopsis dendrobii TaxID=2760662 RepID=A0A7W3VS07_9PSEU|nr:MBL fold metallo-hydrolase [Amycolatopsis dendrobii]MBB1152151.1 MBL fold metallo-hydrolase [Amycolatopsis dendrobii]
MSAQASPRETVSVGDISISYLPDGEASVSAAALFPAGTPELWSAHPELFGADGKLVLSLGTFLIRTGDRKILVDLGFGDRTVAFPAADGEFRSGRLLTSLREEGLAPEDIDTVFFTHLHIDHVGWTARNDVLTFGNARHLAGEGEVEYWQSLGDHPLAAVGPDPHGVLAPLEGRVDAVADGTVIAPGVSVVATPGHTPGHCSLVVSSGPDRALILGDVLHCPAQLTDNEVALAFEVDAELGKKTRARIMGELEGDPNTVAAQCHLTGSAFGRVVRGRSRRTWTSLASQGAS